MAHQLFALFHHDLLPLAILAPDGHMVDHQLLVGRGEEGLQSVTHGRGPNEATLPFSKETVDHEGG